MTIQVLGSGCATCQKLYEITQRAVAEMGLSDAVEYVHGPEGIAKIVALGAMASPVLAVNDAIAMTGFTPDIEKIKQAIERVRP